MPYLVSGVSYRGSRPCAVDSPWDTAALRSPQRSDRVPSTEYGGRKPTFRYAVHMSGFLSIVLVLATLLGGAFGEADATATTAGDGKLNVTFTVHVGGDANAVIAHIVDIGGDQSTTSLAPQGGGEWSGTTVTDAMNLVVVFEAIRPDDSSDLSDPATFATLGVDPALIGVEGSGTTAAADEGYSQRTLRWGWGALGLAALALALLAFWAAGGRDRPRGGHRQAGLSEDGDDRPSSAGDQSADDVASD